MTGRMRAIAAAATALVAGLIGAAGPLRAETAEVRISKGYGILYLPLIVMQDRKLLEAEAARRGLGDVKVSWLLFDGVNVINDAMLSGALDIAGTGAPGFVTLWGKAKGGRAEVVGLAGLSATSLWLNSNRPGMTSLADITANDKIALPGIKTSLSAVVLQMAAAKVFGAENWAKLDPMTVGLPHPDALAALTSGRTEVTAHFTSPPFSYIELDNPKVHRVMNSVDVLGNITLDVVFAPKRFVDANPKLTEAFIAALDDADALIAKDKRAAAEIFVRTSPVKVTTEEVVKMLDDPDTRFSTTPNGVMAFATFLGQAGIIKTKPAGWADMFVPALGSRPGS